MEIKDEIPIDNVAKTVSTKNKRVANKWQQLAKAIEAEKKKKSSQINEHRNKLLRQRNETQTRTVSLSSKRPLNDMTSFQSVCDAVLASMRKSKQVNNVIRERSTASLQRTTYSWEKKKSSRKNMSFSPKELKQKNDVAWNKMVKHESEATSAPERVAEVNLRRPKSAFDFTEEEKEINRMLYSSPTALPKIHLQTQFRPKKRTFMKDAEFQKRVTVNDETWKDVHHCRYLRVESLRRTCSMSDMRSTK